MKIEAVYNIDDNKTTRKWWYGDAAKQSAKAEAEPGEKVYPVDISEGYTLHTDGWAVGK